MFLLQGGENGDVGEPHSHVTNTSDCPAIHTKNNSSRVHLRSFSNIVAHHQQLPSVTIQEEKENTSI